eukprot:306645-Chlamydomonas_euryale.AAC.1
MQCSPTAVAVAVAAAVAAAVALPVSVPFACVRGVGLSSLDYKSCQHPTSDYLCRASTYRAGPLVRAAENVSWLCGTQTAGCAFRCVRCGCVCWCVWR